MVTEGLGTALKPFYEAVILARKPLSEPTVAANVLRHGTGALNIDACRIGTEQTITHRRGHSGDHAAYGRDDRKMARTNPPGRWPSNVAMDEDAAKMLDEMTGERPSMLRPGQTDGRRGSPPGFFGRFKGTTGAAYDDSGGASRFLYVAKASRAERDAGLDGMPLRRGACETMDPRYRDGIGENRMPLRRNPHPTVKPVTLMRWLVKLVTQPGDLVLDPFAGSGTTGMACALEGREFIGIEREPEYADIAERRIANALGPLFADGAA